MKNDLENEMTEWLLHSQDRRSYIQAFQESSPRNWGPIHQGTAAGMLVDVDPRWLCTVRRVHRVPEATCKDTSL